MLVKSIMTSDVKSCSPETTVAAAARIMAHRDCGIVPVVDAEQKLLGVITDRDVCLVVAAAVRSPEELPVRDVMTSKVHTCSPDDPHSAALKLMKNHAVRRVPVVMADRRLVGLISLDDLVVRADSHKAAAVSNEDVFDALKLICARTVAA